MNWDNVHFFLALILSLTYGNYVFLDIFPLKVIFKLFFQVVLWLYFENVFRFQFV